MLAAVAPDAATGGSFVLVVGEVLSVGMVAGRQRHWGGMAGGRNIVKRNIVEGCLDCGGCCEGVGEHQSSSKAVSKGSKPLTSKGVSGNIGGAAQVALT